MLYLLIWAIYGILVGGLAKMLYPGDVEPKGILGSIIIGVVGSYVGGLINYLIGRADALSSTGILMGVIGALLCCWIYDKFTLHKILQAHKMQIRSLQGEVRSLSK